MLDYYIKLLCRQLVLVVIHLHQKLSDQYAFLTERGLSLLKFVGDEIE